MTKDTQSQTVSEKLSRLRAAIMEEGVDGFIVPRADEYQGEYVPPCADRLRWLTGFTGSAGAAIVLKNRAVVMSDGRYTIQLKQQVDSSLFDLADSTKISPADWILEHGRGAIVGFDPRLHTPREIRAMTDKGVVLKPVHNLIDSIWMDRPAPPSARIEIFPAAFAGASVQDKLDDIATKIEERKARAAIITLPDSIAWILNIRSADIPHIPVALSSAIAYADGTLEWFIDPARVDEDIIKTFGNRVSIRPANDLPGALAALRGTRVMVDERRTSVWFSDTLKSAGADVIDMKDPSIAMKARKNRAEQAAMRTAHIRDGVAYARFLRWFSKEAMKETLTEMDVERKLEDFRRTAPEYRDSSFDTIAGYGPNGAIVHYRATPETNKTIERWSLLLLDSGAQYSDGTTDITRTLAVGPPSDEMREHYTVVLKGHIAVASARFPAGTTGAQIDALARAPLWQRNMDYAHGTGHGVGCYLSVHEEATSFSPRGIDPVEPGMIISNEPGYYREGLYGIRLENLVLAHEDGVCPDTGKTMIAFETITFAPFDKTLIAVDMLTGDEKFWLANYHKKVFAELSPYLDEETKAWLYDQTH